MGEVRVEFGDDLSEQATLLLAAAEDLDLDQSVVRTEEGAFVVPEEVADKAGVGEKPAKKAAAKKTAKKKS